MLYDIVYFFIYKILRGLIGLGFVVGLCKLYRNCVVVICVNKILFIIGIVMVYYLGYNLGMFYDVDECKCVYFICIMRYDNLLII